MSIFQATTNQMILLFLFVLLGFFLNKRGLLPQDSHLVMAKLEHYIFLPSLVFITFIDRCTPETIKTKLPLLLYSTGSLVIALILAFLLTGFFTKDWEKTGIYRYSLTVANITFMGNAVMEGIFGEERLLDYLIFTLPLNLFLNTLGISWLIPPKENLPLHKKLLTPVNIATFLGVLAGLCSIPVPEVALGFIRTGGQCMAPVAMILTGFVIGNYPLRQLFSMKKIYILALYRLLALPALVYMFCRLLPVPEPVLLPLTCAYSMPLGLNTIVIPAAYGGDTTLGAAMALVSNLLGLVTIPLVFMLLLP